MTTLKCKFCGELIQLSDIENHIVNIHKGRIEEDIKALITDTAIQVAYIYEGNKGLAANNNNGELLKQVFQKFPVYSCRYIYDPQGEGIGLMAKSYEDFIYGLKHCEAITREGRAYRQKLKPKSFKQAERDVEYAFTTQYRAGAGYSESD